MAAERGGRVVVHSEHQVNRFRWETNIGFRVLLDSSGMPRTALQWASLDGDALRVRWLLSSGENPNADDWVRARTP